MANAISARLSTDRAGPHRRVTEAEREHAAQAAAERTRRSPPPQQDRRGAQSGDQPRAAGAEEAGGGIDRAGRRAAPSSAAPAMTAGPRRRFVRDRRRAPTRVVGVALQQRARRSPAHRAHAEPQREQAGDERADHAGGQPFRRDVQREGGRADGADPPRAQAVHDQRAVADRGRGADRPRRCAASTAPSRTNTRADRRRRESDRRQQADFARALLEADREEQIREQQRRHDEEEAEVEEVLAEVGGALRGGDGLGADVARGEAGGGRIDRLRVDRRRAGRAAATTRLPNRDPHSRCPSASGMIAFGAAR